MRGKAPVVAQHPRGAVVDADILITRRARGRNHRPARHAGPFDGRARVIPRHVADLHERQPAHRRHQNCARHQARHGGRAGAGPSGAGVTGSAAASPSGSGLTGGRCPRESRALSQSNPAKTINNTEIPARSWYFSRVATPWRAAIHTSRLLRKMLATNATVTPPASSASRRGMRYRESSPSRHPPMSVVWSERMPLHASSTPTSWPRTRIRLPCASAGMAIRFMISAAIDAAPRMSDWTMSCSSPLGHGTASSRNPTGNAKCRTHGHPPHHAAVASDTAVSSSGVDPENEPPIGVRPLDEADGQQQQQATGDEQRQRPSACPGRAGTGAEDGPASAGPATPARAAGRTSRIGTGR